MMEQEAIVARIEGDQAYVEVAGAGSGCGRCHEAGGCQSGVLGQIFRRAPRQFRMGNSIGAAPGERVVVMVADGAMLRAALLTYLVPVVLLIIGAFAGTILGGAASADAGALLGALLGLAVAVAAGHVIHKGPAGEAMRPILLRKSSGICIKEAKQ
jgi:sigma-E factor negative regulatory protein RseC